MTKEEIIRLLHEACKDHPEYTPDCPDPEGEDLEVLVKFAELVAQHEREACADICDAYSADKWALYKGHEPYNGMEEGRAEDYVQGQSAGADACGDLLRLRYECNTTKEPT